MEDGASASSVVQTSDGGFIAAGGRMGHGYIVKTDSNGDSIWTKMYLVIGGTYFSEILPINEGGFITTGTTGISMNVYLVRIDHNGDTLWTRTYGGIKFDWAESVLQISDGGFIIAGATESFSAGERDVYLLRTNSTGDTLWTRTYGGIKFDWAESVLQTSDGGFIIAGNTNSFGAGQCDVYLIRTNQNGDTLWTKTYGGNKDDYCNSVKNTSDSGLIITGDTRSFSDSTSNVYLIRLGKETIGIQENNLPNLLKPDDLIVSYNHVTSSISIRYAIPYNTRIKLSAYDIKGKLVKVIEDKFIQKGSYKVNWDTAKLGSGVYFLRLSVNGAGVSRKVTFLR